MPTARHRDRELVDARRRRDVDAIDRDAGLIEALRSREATAAEQLLATYGDRAYRLALRITGNREDAEEALQDAFWNVVWKIDTFRGAAAFGSWVYRIVANAAYQKGRRRAQRGVETPLDDVLPVFDQAGRHASEVTDWSSTVHDAAVQRELREAMASAIGELSPDYRAVIVMRDVEGMSVIEVADALGVLETTVKTRTHRARLQLRKRLARFMERNDRDPHLNRDVVGVA